MADGFNRFNKRWASSAAVAAITENNANVGLDYIGDDPPTTALHNKMFQWLDEKDNYLFEQIRLAIVNAGVPAPTENDFTGLATAIRRVATTTFAGIQRNATNAETMLMALGNVTVTPASLKGVIDALTLGVATAVPAGAVMPFARKTPPVGWVACDGALYDRTNFASLFAAVGTDFGTTTANDFRVPDLRGIFVRGLNTRSEGWDGGRIFGSTQGDTFRAHGHNLTVSAIPAHTHTLNIAAAGDHTHVATAAAAGENRPTGTLNAVADHVHGATAVSAGSHTHTGVTDTRGEHTHTTRVALDRSSGAMGNAVFGDEPTYGETNLGTNAAGSHAHNLSIGTNGAHTHTVSVTGAGGHTHDLTMAVIPAHTHAITVNPAGSHTHTGNTSSAGGFQPTAIAEVVGSTETRPVNMALLYCIKT